MFSFAYRFALRMAARFWLLTSPNSWLRLAVAHDSPHVHSMGVTPDRLLIAGDGASAGVGVLTHELGLPGYLARAVTDITGRATDADIVVSTGMTSRDCREAIAGMPLSRFDVIILTLGGVEALSFANPTRWGADVGELLAYIERSALTGTTTVVMSIPYFVGTSRLPRLLRKPVNRHAVKLNGITAAIVADHPDMSFVVFNHGDGVEPDGRASYSQWAKHLAPAVSQYLSPRGSTSVRVELPDEASRQSALDVLDLVDMPRDPQLDQLVATAKNQFGVSFAAVTLIDSGRQTMASAVGMERFDMPRTEAMCDVTIRRSESLAVEDTLMDPRYSSNPMVQGAPKVRFYAGYPIESPDGNRIGAICVMDVRPRVFTNRDSVLLRDFAQRIQERLWALGGHRSQDRTLVVE